MKRTGQPPADTQVHDENVMDILCDLMNPMILNT